MENRMTKPMLVLIVGAMLVSAACMARTQHAAGHAPAAAEKVIECKQGIYRFFPGEFNFCVALRDEQVGRYRDMVQMLELAAGWGQKRAQFTWGVMYFNGLHVRVDHARGLAWLALAAERQDRGYLGVFSSAYGRSNPVERQRANALLRQMKPRYGDAHAAVRAKVRYDRAIADLTRYEPYSTTACISGVSAGPDVTDGGDPQVHGISGSGDPKQFDTPPQASAPPPCPSLAVSLRVLGRISAVYFRGWETRVDVGPVVPVDAPAASASVGG
jgi:hypothetical protein